MSIRDISPEELQEIVEASKTDEIERPLQMSKITDALLYSGVFMVEDKPGFVMVKESELAMVLEELKKAKNLQMAQQKLVTEQNRVYLKSELDKTQKALQETLEENANLRKQNEGLQRRVDELEYRHVEAKMADMKRIDEAMQEVSLESVVNNQPKRPQPKAAMMLIQEDRINNAEKERFKSIVEADKAKRESGYTDDFGDEELETNERLSVEVKTEKKEESIPTDLKRAYVVALHFKGYKPMDICKELEVSKNLVYRTLSLSRKEIKELQGKYPLVFAEFEPEQINKWRAVMGTKK